MTFRIVYLGIIIIAAIGAVIANDESSPPLVLPPGLEQTLPVNPAESYFGEAIRPVDCPDDDDNPYGTCGNLLFGGLALNDSHINGEVKIKFYPPVKGISHFEMSFPTGLRGGLEILSAPQFFRMPVELSLIENPQDDIVSEGDLNLETGEVTNLNVRIVVHHTGLVALDWVNPELERPVIEYPGIYGSSWAEFEQRDDGLLDISFRGSTFLPLGKSVNGELGGPVPRFPLPFCDNELKCASIPSPGTAFHPHLVLTTKQSRPVVCEDFCLELPTNSILEFDTFARNTSFGDEFKLNIPQLGGDATGRSHLLGRIQIQFGERFGDSLSFHISSLPPAGLMAEPPETPLSVPGISVGLVGHNEYLRFPRQTYLLQDVAFADDPFDYAVGAIDLKSGNVLGGLLYRGFIAQDLLFDLLEQNDGNIAPSSFFFRGPALFEQDGNGQTAFRFNGSVRLDFAGFRFPSPDRIKANSWIAGPGSVLDPFFRIRAIHSASRDDFVFNGNGRTISSADEEFSYSYLIACVPSGKRASFEYTNFGPDGGTFKMHSLASVSCLNSMNSKAGPGEYDTISFTGFGSWSEDDELHAATVQFSTSDEEPYISIQIDGGFLSNVNTKPVDEQDSLP